MARLCFLLELTATKKLIATWLAGGLPATYANTNFELGKPMDWPAFFLKLPASCTFPF